jgi:two-component system, OmpR family, flagellar system response regulator FtcR
MLFEMWDPDHVLPEGLEEGLRAAGHRARTGESGPDLPAAPGTVLLLGEGAELEERVTRARCAGGEAVLITLRTARDSARSARLIRLGADDDLVLPVPVAELVARVEAVRRVHGRGVETTGGASRVFGVTVFADGRPPEIDGSPLPLSAQEGRVLTHLLRSSGRPVPREALHAALFSLTDKAPSGRVVDVHVCNLRRKLRAALGTNAPRITTARGLGYVAGPPAG